MFVLLYGYTIEGFVSWYSVWLSKPPGPHCVLDLANVLRDSKKEPKAAVALAAGPNRSS